MPIFDFDARPLSTAAAVALGYLDGQHSAGASQGQKFHAGAVRFVLLRALGEAFVSSEISEKDIVNAIEELR